MIKTRPPVAVIAGPTASGKSALAIALAERTDGTVINADSAQVYADLEILSARPAPDDLARAEHLLFGTRDAAHPCSAADWAEEARRAVERVHGRGGLPILVGGTGLYLRTLFDGIAPVPEIDPAIRRKVRENPVAVNWAHLAALDEAAAARLRPTDSTRVARSLEVILSTGRSLEEWQKHRTGGIGERVAVSALVLLPPRDWLYARCDGRFEQMIGAGAAEEVRHLLARKLDPALPAMRAIGVPEIAAMLAGKVSRAEAVAACQQATRRYAKRQYTWFANQAPPGWRRFAEPLDSREAVERALALLTSED
ncbi:tRNA (adenosine(37)-N6)-dimethylallyltransferase MiaA [Sphingomonas sp. GCM10030256]|uniref:tRNA (adenosine(37)-N6)-dimethylallyltransferase MiaA n=1 Tax=Sphingomonas sp. GCM10030256 TaxID=3273427 RepID=UPI00361D8EFA